MLLLGIDLGTSSVKISVVDSQTQVTLAVVQYPEREADIISLQPGWAEQSPEEWWHNVQQAIIHCNATGLYDPGNIITIGIAYQMHGLVLINKEQEVIHNAIIWCDSRAVEIGNRAFDEIGHQKCLSHLLNSPGNFTASKLAWIKDNQPLVYNQISKILLPGDFISMKLTGDISTTVSALSEGIFWDFKNNELSADVLQYFGFDTSIFPGIRPMFSTHGFLRKDVSELLSLKEGISVSYKAGDQPNNALSLNVLNPGEVAANAGTSGVIYGVSDQLKYDQLSRINSFAHVNHTAENIRIGVLLCLNGVGIFNKWLKGIAGAGLDYPALNEAAGKLKPGAGGLFAMPFGNGAERMFGNKITGAQFLNINFNTHSAAHMVRAAQESIAFSMRYGLDIMRENGIEPAVVRAAKANLFLSPVFSQAFASVNNVTVEYYEGDGSYGAAIGAGIGAGIYMDAAGAFSNRKPTGLTMPEMTGQYNDLYMEWKSLLEEQLSRVK